MRARYAVVTDPPRIHLNAESQAVMLVPARELLNRSGIGRWFRELDGAYDLQDETRVRVFERVGAIPWADQVALRERIAAVPGAD